MSSKKQHHKILVIGGPNEGKTHFSGQMYLRLRHKEGRFKITNVPDDFSGFDEVLGALYDGRSAQRTYSGADEELVLSLEDSKTGNLIDLTFPDYAGEQIVNLVEHRMVAPAWKEKILESNAWALLIRPSLLKIPEDIITRPPDEKLLGVQGANGQENMKMSSTLFFVELLQMLMHIKRMSNSSNEEVLPRLVVLLSCWDEILKENPNVKPAKYMSEKIPLVNEFIEANWEKEDFTILGLSSTGRKLDDKKPNKEYLNKGPEQMGYFMTSENKEEKDLTLIIEKFL